jgi:hypothetical protein
MQIYTNFANFIRLYFPLFTTIRNLSLQFYSFEDALSSYDNGFRSSCLDQIAGITHCISLIPQLPCHRRYLYWHSPFPLQCSKSCSGGVHTRSVQCMEINSNLISDDRCPEHSRPRNQESCNETPCAVRWVTGDWGEVGLIISVSSSGCVMSKWA